MIMSRVNFGCVRRMLCSNSRYSFGHLIRPDRHIFRFSIFVRRNLTATPPLLIATRPPHLHHYRYHHPLSKENNTSHGHATYSSSSGQRRLGDIHPGQACICDVSWYGRKHTPGECCAFYVEKREVKEDPQRARVYVSPLYDSTASPPPNRHTSCTVLFFCLH